MRPDGLPHFSFDTRPLPQHAQFAAWRDTMSATNDIHAVDRSASDGFAAVLDGWLLNSIVVLDAAIDAQHVSRGPDRIRADQADHYVFLVQNEGVWGARTGDRELGSRAGQGSVLDLARPFDVAVSRNAATTFTIPRDLLDAVLTPFDMHGLVIDGGLGGLLLDHLSALKRHLPLLTLAEVGTVERATVAMIAACLAPQRDRIAAARGTIGGTLLLRARRTIDANLCAPALSVAQICREVGISRSALYRLFEPVGGVAAYIQGRRLDRIRRLLEDPLERRPVAEIAYTHGFASETHFRRAFRRRFGCRPSDARHAPARNASLGRSSEERRISDFIRDAGVGDVT